MSTRMYGPEEKAKLERLINEGQNILREVEDLKEGLRETVKAVAEELEVKPAILKKAIKLAHKATFGQEKQDHETLETILETVGKTL